MGGRCSRAGSHRVADLVEHVARPAGALVVPDEILEGDFSATATPGCAMSDLDRAPPKPPPGYSGAAGRGGTMDPFEVAINALFAGEDDEGDLAASTTSGSSGHCSAGSRAAGCA